MNSSNEFQSEPTTSAPILTLYHCGVNVVPPFWPLTHFGTLKAATDILFRRVEEHPLHEVTIYEARVREPLSPLRVPDFGSPNMLMLLRKLTENQDDKRQEFNALEPVLLSFYVDRNGRTEQGKSAEEIWAARSFIRELMFSCRELTRAEIERLLIE